MSAAACASLAAFVRGMTAAIVIGFAVVVLYKLATGAVRTRGLLSTQDGQPSPNSVQLLMMTVAGALWYVGAAMHAPDGKLPEIPAELLVLVGGSNLTWVGTYAGQWFFGKERGRLMRPEKRES